MPNYQGVWSLSTQYQNASAWPQPFPTSIGVFFGSYVSEIMIKIEEEIDEAFLFAQTS